MSTTCLRCGTTYLDWTCPTCAHRERLERTAREQASTQEALLEAQRKAAEEQHEMLEALRAQAEADAWHAEDLQRTIADEAEEHRQSQRDAIAGSWKLQAQSMADRAWQLLDGDLNQEALELTTRALNQDPGCLDALRCAVEVHTRLGDLSAARVFRLKQIAMLRTEEYSDSPGAFRRVASQCVGDPASLEKFTDLLRESFRRPVFLELLDLSNPNVLDRLRNTPAAPVAHDIARDALRSGLGPNSLIPMAAYALDFSPSSKVADLQLIEGHLRAVPFSKRRKLGEAGVSISKDQRFSGETRAALVEIIRQRLDAWKSESDAAIESDAMAAAKKIPRPTGGRLAGWLVGIGLWVGIAYVGTSLVAAGLPRGTELVFSASAPILGIIVGCLVTRTIRNTQHSGAKGERYRSVKEERSRQEEIPI